MPPFQDLTGQTFGRWTVIDRAPDRYRGYPEWNCRCVCGKTGTVRANILKNGQSRSCGCLNVEMHREMCIARNTTHGMSGTPTYDIWTGMLTRCQNPAATGYPKYGAKGVRVCERWQKFENFLADMGERPTPKHTLDRCNTKGNYQPSNCRWVTMKVQQNNRSNNVRYTMSGESLTVGEWARKLGITPTTIYNRLNAGWPLVAVLSPIRLSRWGTPRKR